MRKFRIVELQTGKFRVEYFETNFFANPFRQWDSWQSCGYESLDTVQEIYDREIMERNYKLLKNKVKNIIKSELSE